MFTLSGARQFILSGARQFILSGARARHLESRLCAYDLI